MRRLAYFIFGTNVQHRVGVIWRFCLVYVINWKHLWENKKREWQIELWVENLVQWSGYCQINSVKTHFYRMKELRVFLHMKRAHKTSRDTTKWQRERDIDQLKRGRWWRWLLLLLLAVSWNELGNHFEKPVHKHSVSQWISWRLNECIKLNGFSSYHPTVLWIYISESSITETQVMKGFCVYVLIAESLCSTWNRVFTQIWNKIPLNTWLILYMI